MPTIHDAHAAMFGLARHGELYERWAGRLAGGQAKAVTFTVADAAALPCPDVTFDLVVSTISQHHWSDPGAGLRELNRVLRPDAQAWIYDFRLALRRAQTAARTVSPPPLIARQSPLEGTSQFNPIGRLVLRTAP